MPTDEANSQHASYRMPKFHFQVDFGGVIKNISFQEVSGLDAETKIIEYRKGDSKDFSTIKMPGIMKYGNVTMKRGVFINGDNFWNWYNTIKLNTINRITVLIKLLDETGNVTMQWELHNAWPVKITSADLKSDNNEVAIDTLEIAYENLTISNS